MLHVSIAPLYIASHYEHVSLMLLALREDAFRL